MTSSHLTPIFRTLFTFASKNDWNIPSEALLECAQTIAQAVSPSRADQKYMTRRECASFLRISLPTLDRYIREENLPSVIKNPLAKTRKHRIFPKAEVETWAKSHLSSIH